ncbi:substrate-binding domain-containing protein [Marinomonas sp. 15G1-11]|uniref:Substrate-binding domain-containing protein n=1 Tax=Marinomonas phaeophyticola TaxID=3004091 RepID=A0ABT4JX61_9GAMM|nr:substrate-binding domain-containing protein [Marinomonas sp. 15G1-11]MCZ2722960.1 substrate-binding domain-containing protein [Marinomonas sp. 15G1-11]
MQKYKFTKLILAAALASTTMLSHAAKLEVGAILLDTRGEWMSEVIHGMEAAGEELDVKVRIVDSNGDLSKEASLIDNFIARQVDAITLSPLNDESSIAAFERAVDAGIPVITWNSKVNSPKSKYFVGVNNYDLGKKTGEVAVEYIKNEMDGKANLAVIGTHKYSVGLERVNGFLDQVKALPGVKIVANQDAEYVELGLTVTENILEANPDVNLVWAWNLTSMLGAYAAIDSKQDNKPMLMGTDMSLDVARYMENDNSFLLAVTTQQPYEIGRQSIYRAVDVAKAGQTDSEVLVPLKTYHSNDKQSLKEYNESRDYLK